MPEARKRLEGAMRDLLGGKQDKPRLFPGALGAYVDGVKQLKVQGRPDFVYVRLRGAASEVIQAFNDAVGLHWDLPVLVYRDPLAKHLWRIYARDIGQYESWGGASYLPPHALSHSFVGGPGGGSDVVWVQKRQLMPLLGRPDTSGSMSVWVEPDYYYWDDLYHYWPGSGTSSLIGSKPTGTHTGRFVTVYLDGDAGILRTLNGVEFDIVYPPADPSLYIPVPTGSVGIPIVAVFLTTGTDRIGWGELYDLRGVVSSPAPMDAATTSSGSVVVLDESVLQGAATQFDFLGDGVAASVVDGIATVVVNPLFIQDEMAPQGYATAMDFQGAGVNAAVVAGQAVITIPGGGAVSVPVTGSVVLLDEGIIQGSVTALDVRGAQVQANRDGTTGTFVFSLPTTGSVVVEDEGLIRGSAPILDFVGPWVAAGVVGGVATVTIPPVTGSSAVVNEAGADADVRFEGDTDPNLLTLDAGLDVIGIGGAGIAGQKLSVYGDMQASGYTGWNFANETWTRVSATTFTVPTDLTAKYQKGTKIKLTDTTTKYFYVVASSYSAPDTTVVVTGGSDYSLVGAISNPFYSYAENPRDFPDWFNWAPVLVGFSIDPTNTVYRFKIVGRCVTIVERQITPGTSNDTVLTMSLPVVAATIIVSHIWNYVIHSTVDNGILEYTGDVYVLSGGSTAIFRRPSDGAWTNSGAKRVPAALFLYEI